MRARLLRVAGRRGAARADRALARLRARAEPARPRARALRRRAEPRGRDARLARAWPCSARCSSSGSPRSACASARGCSPSASRRGCACAGSALRAVGALLAELARLRDVRVVPALARRDRLPRALVPGRARAPERDPAARRARARRGRARRGGRARARLDARRRPRAPAPPARRRSRFVSFAPLASLAPSLVAVQRRRGAPPLAGLTPTSANERRPMRFALARRRRGRTSRSCSQAPPRRTRS